MHPLSLLAGYQVAVPVEILGDLAAHLGDGAVLVHEGRARLNPLLAITAAPAPARTLLERLERCDHLDEVLLAEAIRLSLETHQHDRTLAHTRTLLARARVAGTADLAVAEVERSGSAPAWVEACRSEALWLFTEAGRLAEVRPLLGPADGPLEALQAVRTGHPQRALVLLTDQTGAWPALVRARALHNLGRPRSARAELPSPPADPMLLAEWEELTVLLEAELLDEHGTPRLPVEGRMHPWEDRLITARVRLRLGDLGGARADLDVLQRQLDDTEAPRVRAQAEFIDALVSFYQGNHPRLAAQLRRLDDRRGLGTTTVWQHARAVEALARSAWTEASSVLDSLGGDNDYGLRPMLAWIALQRGDLDRAEGLLDPAERESGLFLDELAWLRRIVAHRRGRVVDPAPRSSPCLTVRIADLLLDAELHLDAGDAAAASGVLDDAEALVESGKIGVRRADLQLLRADVAARSGDPPRALHHLDLARASLPHPDAPAARLETAARARLIGTPVDEHLLRQWAGLPDPLAIAIASGTSRKFMAPPGGPRLTVQADGRRFRVGDQPTVDLGRRHTVRRVLVALATARVRRAGPLDLPTLFAAGWPDEQIRSDAAANRLHVALHHLRSRGLGDWVVFDGDGWTLLPDAHVVVVSDLPAAPSR